ncbi:hypothetical protein GW17_00005969 [Ensete ventricosum]|nr:hypothetical protein GW17_00005969 [Ensete ventricosum]
MKTSNVEPRREEMGLPQIRTPMDANGASGCSFVSRKQRKGCSILSIKQRSGCLRKAARVLLGLETADAKVHRRSRLAAVLKKGLGCEATVEEAAASGKGNTAASSVGCRKQRKLGVDGQ